MVSNSFTKLGGERSVHHLSGQLSQFLNRVEHQPRIGDRIFGDFHTNKVIASTSFSNRRPAEQKKGSPFRLPFSMHPNLDRPTNELVTIVSCDLKRIPELKVVPCMPFSIWFQKPNGIRFVRHSF